MKILILTLFLSIILIVESKYEIILDRYELPLGDKDKMFRLHTARVRKFNRTTAVLSGVYEFFITVDNSMIISFEAYNLSGGQYKKLFGRTIGPACDVLFNPSAEKDVRKFMEHTNISVSFGTCPIHPEVISVNDWFPDGLGDFLPPYIPGNERWKLIIWISKDNEVIGGLTYYAILRDEQKLFDSKWKK